MYIRNVKEDDYAPRKSATKTKKDERKKEFRAICSTPFTFEGQKKMKLAKEVVDQFSSLPEFSYFEFEAKRNVFGNLGIREVFKKLDREFYGIWKS
jgi:hypothetical protein